MVQWHSQIQTKYQCFYGLATTLHNFAHVTNILLRERKYMKIHLSFVMYLNIKSFNFQIPSDLWHHPALVSNPAFRGILVCQFWKLVNGYQIMTFNNLTISPVPTLNLVISCWQSVLNCLVCHWMLNSGMIVTLGQCKLSRLNFRVPRTKAWCSTNPKLITFNYKTRFLQSKHI